MDEVKAEALRQEIFEKVREYWRLVHAPAQNGPFRPGESKVNYAGRVFDDAEMVALTDAALEFWLTAGRFTATSSRSWRPSSGRSTHCW